MKLLKNRLLLNALGTLFMRILLLGSAFLTSVVLARLLGPDGFGLYSYVMALATIASVVASLGLPGYAIKELAILGGRSDFRAFNGFIFSGALYVTSASLIVGLLLVLYWHAFGSGAAGNTQIALVLVVLIPLSVLFQYCESVLRSQGKTVLSQVPELLFRRTIFLAIMVVVFIIGIPHFGAVTGVYIQALAITLGLIYFVYYIFNHVVKPNSGFDYVSDYRGVLRGSFPFMATSLLFALNDQIGVLLIKSLSTISMVGYYRVAYRAAEVVVLVGSAADMVIQPKFARLYAEGSHSELQKLMKQSARITAGVSLIIAIIMITFKSELLSLYGRIYVTVGTAFIILLIGQIVTVMMGPVVSLLSMIGRQSVILMAVFASLVANVILGVMLIPKFGLEGAALASAGSLILWKFILMHYAKVKCGFNSNVF